MAHEGNSISTNSGKDTSEARGKGMAMAWHTPRGEDNSKERMNETRTNKRIKKE